MFIKTMKVKKASTQKATRLKTKVKGLTYEEQAERIRAIVATLELIPEKEIIEKLEKEEFTMQEIELDKWVDDINNEY